MGDALKGYLDEAPPQATMCDVCQDLYCEEDRVASQILNDELSGKVPKNDVHNAVHESGNRENWTFGQFGSMRRKFRSRSPGVNIFTLAERLMQPPCYLLVDTSLHSMFFRKLAKVCKELLSMEIRPLEVPISELRRDYVAEGCTILLSEYRHNFQTAQNERILTIYPTPIPWSRMLTIFLLVFVEDDWYVSSGRFSVPEKIRLLLRHVYGPADPSLVMLERGNPTTSLFLPDLSTYEQSTLLQNVARALHAQCREKSADFTLNIQQYVTWIKVYRRRDDLIPLLAEDTQFVAWRKHPAIRYLIKAIRAFSEFIRGNHCDGFAPMFVSILDKTVESVEQQTKAAAKRRSQQRIREFNGKVIEETRKRNLSKSEYVPGFDGVAVGEDLDDAEKRILGSVEKDRFRDLRAIKWVDVATVLYHLKENMLWGEIQCFAQDRHRMTDPLVFSVEERDADSVLYTLKMYAERGRDEVSHGGSFTFDSYRVYRFYKGVVNSGSHKWVWQTYVMVERMCWQFLRSKMLEEYACCQENMIRSNMTNRMKYYPLAPVVANEYFYGKNPISAARVWITWISRNIKERRHLLSCVRSVSDGGFSTELATHTLLKAMFPTSDDLYQGILDMWPTAYPKQVLQMSHKADTVLHWKCPVLYNKEGVPHSPPGFIWPFLSLWMHTGEHRVAKFVLKQAELVEDYEDVVRYIHEETDGAEGDDVVFPKVVSELPMLEMDVTCRIRHASFNGDDLGDSEELLYADRLLGVARENTRSSTSTHRHWMHMCIETQSTECLRHVYPSDVTITPFAKSPFRNNFHLEYIRFVDHQDYMTRGSEVGVYQSRVCKAHHPAHRNINVLDHVSWTLTHEFSCALERVLLSTGHNMYRYPKGDARGDFASVFPFRGEKNKVMGPKWTTGTFEYEQTYPLLEDTRDTNNTRIVMSDACVMMTLTAEEEKYRIPGHSRHSSYLFNNMYVSSTKDDDVDLCEVDMRRWRGFQKWWHKCLDYCKNDPKAKPEDVKFKKMALTIRLSKRLDGLGGRFDFEDRPHAEDGWATPHDLIRHSSNVDVDDEDGLLHAPLPTPTRKRKTFQSPETTSSPSSTFIPILSPAATPDSTTRRDPPTMQLPQAVVKKIKLHHKLKPKPKPAPKITLFLNPNPRLIEDEDLISETE